MAMKKHIDVKHVTFVHKFCEEVNTLEEKPHFSTCLRRLKVSFAPIFYQK
jgi:hypothetical protein